jgi:hypothetical protein
MNDTTVNELKDFITLTISQQNKDLRTELLDRISLTDKKFGKVHRHLGHIRGFVAESIDTAINATDAVLVDHEARLFDLETDSDTSEEIGLFTTVNRHNYNIPRRPELVR